MPHCLTCCLAKQNKTWAKLRVGASSLRSFMRVQTKNKSPYFGTYGLFCRKIDLSLPYDDKSSGPICFPLSHCYLIRLNLRKMVPFYFYLSVFLGIFWQRIFGFLWGILEGPANRHSHPSPFWKNARMALF